MDQNVSTLPLAGAGTDPAADTVEHVWNTDTQNQVAKYAALVGDIAKKREALNTKLAAGKAGLVVIGFHKEALAAAISYAKTPEEDRHNWDESYIFGRKALGCPLQQDLFMTIKDNTELMVESPKGKDPAVI